MKDVKKNNKLASELNAEIFKLKNAVENLKNDVNIIQNGDNDGPFWNGALACCSLKEVLRVAERGTVLVNELEACSKKIINK